MVLTCAGMSSGPSVSWLHPAFSGASRSSAVVKSSSTVGSAFSWIVSDAEVWRMNSVTAPSFAPASSTNVATSAVRSVKPRPDVCTVNSEDTTVAALTADGGERESDFDEVMDDLSTSSSRRTPGRRRASSNPAGDVLLHPVGHIDQPPPCLLQKRHHAIHV